MKFIDVVSKAGTRWAIPVRHIEAVKIIRGGDCKLIWDEKEIFLEEDEANDVIEVLCSEVL